MYSAVLGISFMGCSDDGSSSLEHESAVTSSETISEESAKVSAVVTTASEISTIPRITFVSIEKRTIIITKSVKIQEMELTDG